MINLKKVLIGAVASVAVAAGIWYALPAHAVCDGYINVVKCGTPTHQSLKDTYYGSSHMKTLYNRYYINDSMINGTGMKTGTVYKDGRVVVDGKTVATGARTIQSNTRHPGSSYGTDTVDGHTYYKFNVQNSFVYDHFEVFAWFDSYGKFIAAVIKDCGNPVWAVAVFEYKNIQVCDLTTNKIVTIKENEFNSKRHSKNINDCKQIQVCDLASYKIVTIKEKEFNSKKHSKNINDCKKIQVCELSSSTIVTIRESEFDSKKHSKNLSDCEKMQVCELKTGNIVTIKQSEFSQEKHSKDLSDCENVKVCRIKDKSIVTVKKSDLNDEYTTDMSKCETPTTPPTTPNELPHTGLGSMVAPLVGLGSLAAVATAYVMSRRQLQ